MPYPATLEVQALIQEFRQLATDLERRWPPSASAQARLEWESFQRQWPTDDDIRHGVVNVAPRDLSVMLTKAKRFATILRGSAPAIGRYPSALLHRDGEG